MTTSNANVTTTNMELTPVRVNYKGVDLGGTLDNVALSVAYTKAEIKADQLGETILDKRVSGLNITITTALAEQKLKDNWKVVFPHAKLITDGPNKALLIDSQVGDSDLARSGVLLLHPLSLPDSDLSQDHKFFKATSTAESEISFGPTEQTKIPVIWMAYPDTAFTPARFYFHGDEAVGLVDATADAAVPGGGDTGDGTVGSVSVFTGITVDETITLTCVTAVGNGGVFDVNGSISGPLGLATVAVGFTAVNPAVIAFTISDGAADFIVGDSFTIVTNAGNYA